MKKYFAVVAVLSLAFATHLRADETPLRSGDTFELRIGGVPAAEVAAINGTYTIDGEGYLNLPYIGKMSVNKLTPSQIQSTAEHAYIANGIYTHPTITLTVAPSARFVNVGGQVKAPQRVQYSADMTVLSAITAAGDFNEYADQKKVRLIRGSQVTIVNCKAIRQDPSQDLKVVPGDQIQVPQGMF